jgi:hypothetical protein
VGRNEQEVKAKLDEKAFRLEEFFKDKMFLVTLRVQLINSNPKIEAQLPALGSLSPEYQGCFYQVTRTKPITTATALVEDEEPRVSYPDFARILPADAMQLGPEELQQRCEELRT